MLVELYGENFGCFQDEFRLSMIASNKIDPRSNRGIIEVPIQGQKKPLRLLRSVAIYGPNASGKSTIIRAALALHWLIHHGSTLQSDAPIDSYHPFALNSAKQKPCRLGITAVIKQHVYNYEIQFNHEKFLSEQLTQINPDNTLLTLFDRQNKTITGQWTDNSQFNLITQDFRPNALILALADRFTPKLTKKIAVYLQKLLPNIVDFTAISDESFFQSSPIPKRIYGDSSLQKWMLEHLKFADIGVTEIENLDPIPIEKTDRFTFPFLLKHRGLNNNAISIPYHHESRGTHQIIRLSPYLYDIIHDSTPSTLFTDEINNSLHPILLQGILRYFNCELPITKIHGQLIFTTHDTSLLDDQAQDAILRRDQIYFTEKDSQGRASLYSVADFKERQVHNIGQRYLQGRYGAIPALGSFGE